MADEGTPTAYYFASGEKDVRRGPFSGSQLKQFAKQGVLKPTDVIWKDGSTQGTTASGTTASRIKGLFAAAEEAILVAELVESEEPPVIQNDAVAAQRVGRPVEQFVVAEVVDVATVSPFAANAKTTTAPTALLEDPMREISERFGRFLWIMFYCLVPVTLFALILYFASSDASAWPNVWSAIHWFWILFIGFWILLIWWRAFAPRRNTDVIYLRSFKNDEVSWPIRVAMQDALGDQIRLSGIRAPRRRSETIGDGLSPWLKAMRHCTPKFMDLEAEHDWQARLWNSLQSGGMAVVDLSVVTPFVLEEVQLATRAIEVDRVLFLGTSPQTEKELREIVEAQLGREASAKANVLVWPAPAAGGNRAVLEQEFRQRFKALANEIAARPLIQRHPVPAEYVTTSSDRPLLPMSRHMIKWMIGTQVILLGIPIFFSVVAAVLTPSNTLREVIVAVGMTPILIMNLGLLVTNFILYIRDVGIPRRRIRASLLLGLLLFTAASWMIPWMFGGQQAVDRRPMLSDAELQADAALLQAEDSAARNR